MSDGSHKLVFRDPKTFEITRQVQVKDPAHNNQVLTLDGAGSVSRWLSGLRLRRPLKMMVKVARETEIGIGVGTWCAIGKTVGRT
eukprot:3731811-Rhodomonas_salina.1